MIPKILLAMESITEELTMGMKSECETLTLTIHLRVVVQLILQHLTALIKKLHWKKIGEILPGTIGAIASFIFKTAGEAVGFLAKNAWLLILAAVMFMIEKFKREQSS